MRHAIIGNGNLGNALAKEIIKNGEDFKIFSTTTGWKYPASDLTKIHDFMPDHVWLTVGAGSVEQAQADYKPFSDLHIKLPVDLAQQLNSAVHLHLFSTDYCAGEPKSLYALSKRHMEDAIALLNRPKTFIYRVGSLYGTFKPHKCFPYKLKRNAVSGKTITLPVNQICPTPVDWLTTELIHQHQCWTFGCKDGHPISVSPTGCTTVKEFGELILGRPLESSGLDPKRPEIYTNEPLVKTQTWRYLWNAREVDWL